MGMEPSGQGLPSPWRDVKVQDQQAHRDKLNKIKYRENLQWVMAAYRNSLKQRSIKKQLKEANCQEKPHNIFGRFSY